MSRRLRTNAIILVVVPILFARAKAADPFLMSDLPIHPKVNFALIPLKPGAVQPEGWLRDWAKSAAAAITGHLDEWSPTYGMAWKGVDFKARGVQVNGTGWPLEQCAYWLDGLVRLAYILDAPDLIQKAQSRLDPVVEGVLKGNPSFIHWCPIETSENGFNNWAHSHMGRALVAYYQATGNKHILDALVRVYSSFPVASPDLQFDRVCGSVNLDPLLETYCMSGEPRLIENALSYTKRQDFISMVKSYKDRALITGHVVIFYENIRVPAIAYPWTGNKDHLVATINILQQAERLHGLPMGLISGEEHAAGIGSTRNVETCNVAAGAWTLNWLLRITGERQYADRLEKIFFNAGPSPASRDFSTMCYYQSPNRLAAGFLSEAPQAPGGYEAYRFNKLGHSVLCCVGNLNRVIPN